MIGLAKSALRKQNKWASLLLKPFVNPYQREMLKLYLFIDRHNRENPLEFMQWFSCQQMNVYLYNCLLRHQFKRDANVLSDHLITDLEYRIRELGVDNSKVYDRYFKELVSMHFGASLAYDEGIESMKDGILASAVWRNVYQMDANVNAKCVERKVEYMRSELQRLFATYKDYEGLMGEVEQALESSSEEVK
jgi:hypothetical protein